MSDYPEHDKLRQVSHLSQAVYDFLEWVAAEHGAELAVRCPGHREDMMPVRVARDRLLAQHFDIDLDKLEDEKRAMLDEMRAAQPR